MTEAGAQQQRLAIQSHLRGYALCTGGCSGQATSHISRRPMRSRTAVSHQATSCRTLQHRLQQPNEVVRPPAHLVGVHARLHTLGEGRGVVLHAAAAQGAGHNMECFIDQVTMVGGKDELVVPYSTPQLRRGEGQATIWARQYATRRAGTPNCGSPTGSPAAAPTAPQ